jgi:hypothetical protein
VASTATQNDAEAHDTEVRFWFTSMKSGALHELPSNVNASPLSSTATQKDPDAHDTDVRNAPGLLTSDATAAGDPHVPPLNVTASPLVSTARQNDVEGHEID